MFSCCSCCSHCFESFEELYLPVSLKEAKKDPNTFNQRVELCREIHAFYIDNFNNHEILQRLAIFNIFARANTLMHVMLKRNRLTRARALKNISDQKGVAYYYLFLYWDGRPYIRISA